MEEEIEFDHISFNEEKNEQNIKNVENSVPWMTENTRKVNNANV